MADDQPAATADTGTPGPAGTLTDLLAQLAAAPEGAVRAWSRELKPGEVLDRFEVIRELGRGGFGVVYEARDRELGRRVALKTLRPGRARDEWSDAQLQEEAQAAASLSHPGIVTLFEACTCDRGPYLVMELLHGETLEERLQLGPLPVGEAVEVGLQVAGALANVHEHGLVHRDVKPGNLFLGKDGQVKLLDLGLAHLLGRKSSTGGTPAYVAPEQWRGEAVDGRADVFSLGAVLYELCTGRRAFEVKAGRSSALDAGPAPALTVRAPRALARLVAQCLEKDPTARPTSAQVVAGLLEVRQGLERPRARRRLAALVAAGMAVGIAGALFASRTPVDPLAPGPDGRIIVAVADFANETGDPGLDGLSGLLTISLEQSRRLRVLTRSRLLDLSRHAGQEKVAKIDEVLARDLGRRAGVQALALGTVRGGDDVQSVELEVIDPRNGGVLFTERDRAKGRGGILETIDRLAQRVRVRLKESDDSIEKSRRPVAGVTTTDLDAWEHYVAGRQAYDQADPEAARRELEAAIAIDPGFALARYRLAFASAWKAGTLAPDPLHAPDAKRALAPLLGQVDHLPDKERLAVLAWRASEENRTVEALALRDEAATAFPDDEEAAYYAGEARFHQGDVPGALPWFERAFALDPMGPGAMLRHLVRAYWVVDRREEALAMARRCAEASRAGFDFAQLAFAFLATGREAEASEPLRVAVERGSLPAISYEQSLYLVDSGRALEAEQAQRRALAELRARRRGDAGSGRDGPSTLEEEDIGHSLLFTLLAQGRVRESRVLVAAAPASGVPAGKAAAYPMTIAMATRSLGDARRAIQSLERAGALRTPSAQFDAAFALAFAGDVAAAEPYAVAGLASLELADAPRIIRQQYDAVVMQHGGKLDEAAAILRLAAQTPDVMGRQGSLRLLGEVELLRGDARAAATALESALAITWSPAVLSRGFDLPRTLLHAALAQERLGDAARARERVERLLAGWWGRADADFAPAAEARALLARLDRGQGR